MQRAEQRARDPYQRARPPGRAADTADGERKRDRSPKIRCPLCKWQPDGKPYWQCERCLTSFDTFKTRARCPACPNRWHLTQCIACHKMSPHDDWYTDE